ncbi:hypothetical protein D3C75_769430 [compost metagenome]
MVMEPWYFWVMFASGIYLIFLSGSDFCRGWGSAVLLLVCLPIVLSGCTKDVPKDIIVPSGAITVNVPVPTCGDDLAKTLFKDSSRPEVLPINLLTEADKGDFDKVYRAYVDTVALLTKYAVQQERDRAQAQQQCVAIRRAADSLNTKTPVIPVQK